MAKKSKIIANQKRIAIVAQYRELRTALKETIRNPKLPEVERQAARLKLESLPKNSNPIRVRNRCVVTGRPRAVLKKFRLSRTSFRELALKGEIPGVIKASW